MRIDPTLSSAALVHPTAALRSAAPSFEDVLAALHDDTEAPPSNAMPANGPNTLKAPTPHLGSDSPAAPDETGVLDPPDGLEPQIRDHAFGFDELGVLGAHAATAARGMAQPKGQTSAVYPRQSAPVTPSLAPRSATLGRTPVVEGEVTSAASQIDPGPPVGGSSLPTDAARTMAGPAEPDALAIAAPAETPALASGDDVAVISVAGSGSPALADVRTQRAVQPAPAARLSLSVDNGGLQVVAAAADLSPQDHFKLRRQAADISAAFGLRLTGLRLNGVAITDPSTHPLGVTHGRFSR